MLVKSVTSGCRAFVPQSEPCAYSILLLAGYVGSIAAIIIDIVSCNTNNCLGAPYRRIVISCQADVPLDVYWHEKREVTVVAEGRKAQSTLLRAQDIAKDTYHESLVSCSSCLCPVPYRNENHEHTKALGVARFRGHTWWLG